jgi:hypothetical protein
MVRNRGAAANREASRFGFLCWREDRFSEGNANLTALIILTENPECPYLGIY